MIDLFIFVSPFILFVLKSIFNRPMQRMSFFMIINILDLSLLKPNKFPTIILCCNADYKLFLFYSVFLFVWFYSYSMRCATNKCHREKIYYWINIKYVKCPLKRIRYLLSMYFEDVQSFTQIVLTGISCQYLLDCLSFIHKSLFIYLILLYFFWRLIYIKFEDLYGDNAQNIFELNNRYH